MNGVRISDQNNKARLAAQFNQFYLQVTSQEVSQIGNYQILEEIGEGAFGKVYLAKHIILNIHVVLKCGLIDDPNIVREVYYHRQLKHKNIVKLYEIIKTEKHLWMVLEYCQGSELFYYIYEKKRIEYHECQNIFFQILIGLKHVHSLNLAHRDLKLENILFANKRKSIVKLTDFGFIREFVPHKRQFLTTVCGTTVYMAPELIKNEKYSGFAIDIWSLGVILFTMLYGEMPFDEDDDLKTKYKIVHEEPLYRSNIPQEAIDLLQKMLSKDPRSRPGINEILNSYFMIDINNKHIEKAQRSSLHNDSESIISISQHYNSNIQPFHSKIDRLLLKKFEKLNINIDQLQNDVLNGQTSPLTAFYELSLTQEFSKKKKHYKEKKKKYFEAKKSLLNSRKKVKSVLSLSDQNSGPQPLERIISSLSLSSNRNNASKTNLSKVGSRKSVEFSDPQRKQRGPELNRNSFTGNRINRIPSNIRTDQSQDWTFERMGSTDGSNLQKTVSFHQEDKRRRSSNATTAPSSVTGSENLKKNKNSKIFNKLQFWKKNKNANRDEVLRVNKYDEETKAGGIPFTSAKHDMQEDLLQPDARRLPSPKSIIDRDNEYAAPLIETRDTTLVNEIDSPNPSGEIQGRNESKEDLNQLNNANEDPNLLDSPNRQVTPTLDIFPASSKHLKARPSSVVSQMSQFSHLSQLSTMTESDVLGETDTMDEEEYDEDGIYESSLEMSHLDQRPSASGNTPTSNSPVTTGKLAMVKKRPSYRRTLSSDISIMSTSTSATGNPAPSKTQQRKSLSRLSSNSSEESSIKSIRNTNLNNGVLASPSPTFPLTVPMNDLNSNRINRPKSPELIKPSKKKALINSRLWKHSQDSPSNSQPLLSNKFGVSNLLYQLDNNEMFARSHSPPLPKKFNKLKINGYTKRNSNQNNNSSFSVKATWPANNNARQNDNNYTNQNDQNLVWNNDMTINPSTQGRSMYQPKFIINEEEEEEN